MRLTLLIAVASLFAVAAYGAPIASDTSNVLQARALDPQLFERDVVENSTPPHCEEEPPSPQRRGSGNQSWRRGSGNQSWRRGTSSPSSCSKEQGSPSQSWRRRRGDLQFEQRETIAEIE